MHMRILFSLLPNTALEVIIADLSGNDSKMRNIFLQKSTDDSNSGGLPKNLPHVVSPELSCITATACCGGIVIIA
jgi:hypothetical protein